MRVGIMSDSHGDVIATRMAVELLTEQGAEHFFHCGDLCGDDVLAELAGLPCTFVWGNCDDPSPLAKKFVESLGLSWPREPVRVELAGKRIAVYHGHERGFDWAIEEDGLDYLFHGHTHQRADHRIGHCRVINPGALYRANPRTCACLDLEFDQLEFHLIEVHRARNKS